MSQRILALLCGGLCVCGLLSAATITTPSVAYSVVSSGDNEHSTTATGSLAQFDPALGTLTKVELVRTNSIIDATMSVSNTGAGAVSISADIEMLGTIEFYPSGDSTGFWGWTGFISSNYVNSACSSNSAPEFNSCSHDSPQYLSFPGPSYFGVTPLADINQFIGTGVIDFTVASGMITMNVTSQPSGGFYGLSKSNASGNIALRYTYDPVVATPEPASWALLGLGLIGITGFTRHKFRRN